MSETAMGFMVKSDRFPPRGERIAAWAAEYLRRTGQGVGELAFRLHADKRDVRRLLNEHSCGPRLNDAFEAAFGHDFIDAVAAPLVGGDRITVLEREIASERARIAALDARIEREKAARSARALPGHSGLRLVAPEERRASA